MNTYVQQQKLADFLRDLKDPYIVGIINDYEMAGKILKHLSYSKYLGVPVMEDENDAEEDTQPEPVEPETEVTIDIP